jgi:hypothetical protein
MSQPSHLRLRLTAAAIVALAAALIPAHAQDGPRPSSRYSQTLPDAHPDAIIYLDFPFPRLRQAVPPLKGLSYESKQDQLPAILSGVARSIASALPKLPDLVSRENIYHFQSARDPSAAGGQANAQPWSREFRYLILCHHTSDGSTWIEESRTDGKGHPIDLSALFGSPRGLGFAYQWLLFSAANQPDFRFRYLGQQTKDGRKTFVIAFAQSPEKVSTPANFQSGDKVLPFFFQGVLWVDQSTFDIVLLRTDLLAPIPSLNLRELTTEVHFTSVPIHGLDSVFWLPREVDISSDQGTGSAEENHRYSDYHLFHSTATIVPVP